MNKTFKKYLITATTLVLLALVVLLCVYPYSNKNGKTPFKHSYTARFEEVSTSNGVIRRYDGLLQSAEDTLSEGSVHNFNDGSTALRFHKDPAKITDEYTKISSEIELEKFLADTEVKVDDKGDPILGEDGKPIKTQKSKGILTNDIALRNAKLKQHIFASGRSLDGNGYNITISAVVQFEDADAATFATKEGYNHSAFFGKGDGSTNLAGAGYLVGINEGTISNLTIIFESNLTIPSNKNEYAAATQVVKDKTGQNYVACVGLLAGINSSIIENVCVDVNNSFVFYKEAGAANNLKNGSAFVGGVTGLAGRKSKLTRATVNNNAGIACYTKGGISSATIGGVVGNIATGTANDNVKDSANMTFISVGGTGKLDCFDTFAQTNKRQVLGGVLGGAITLDGDKLVVNAVNNATMTGFVSAWKGDVTNNDTEYGEGSKKGQQKGMPFGRILPIVKSDAGVDVVVNTLKNVLLLFDYSINGTKGTTTWYGGGAIDMDAKITVWSEAYASEKTQAKGSVSAGFNYANVDTNNMLYAVGYGKGADKFDNIYTGADNKLKTDGGMVWSVTTVGAEEVEQVTTTYAKLSNAVANYAGNTTSSRYLYDFGEVVGIKYVGESSPTKKYNPTEPIVMPTIEAVSSIDTNLSEYNSKELSSYYKYHIKYTTPTGKLVTLSSGKGNNYNSGVSKTIFPGKYQIRTSMDSASQAVLGGINTENLAYFDNTNKIIALDKTSDSDARSSYEYTLTQRTLETVGFDPVGWSREYHAKFQIDGEEEPGLMDGVMVRFSGGGEDSYETPGFELDFKFTGTTSKEHGGSFKFTPYKNFEYYNEKGEKIIERINVADTLTKTGIKVDNEAPIFGLVAGNKDMYSTFNYYEYDATAEDNNFKGAPIPNFDRTVWRGSPLVVEYYITDGASGLDKDDVVPGGEVINKFLIFKDNIPQRIEVWDIVGNKLSAEVQFKVDPIQITLTPKIVGFNTMGTAFSKASIVFQCTAGASGAVLEFSYTELGKSESWEKLGEVVNGTVTLTKSLNFNLQNATLRARLRSKSDEKGTVYAGKSNMPVNTENSSDDSVMSIGKGDKVVNVFSITLFKFKVRLDPSNIQFSTDGGANWAYMNTLTVEDWVAKAKKTYDGTTDPKIMFRPLLATNNITDGVTMVVEDEAELPSNFIDIVNSDVDIVAKYNQSTVGGTELVLTGVNSNTDSIVEFWDKVDVEKSLSKNYSIKTLIESKIIEIDLSKLKGEIPGGGLGEGEIYFKMSYLYGESIVKTFTYFDKESGREFVFEVVCDAVKGANAKDEPYPITRVFVQNNSDNYTISFINTASIKISQKPVSVDATVDGQNVAGDISFDGKSRVVYGYYVNVDNKKVDAIATIYKLIGDNGTPGDPSDDKELVPPNADGKSIITDIGKYEVVFTVADTNYIVKANSAIIKYTVKQGRLNINQEQQVVDFSMDDKAYAWSANFADGVKQDDIFNIKNVVVQYFEYGSCKLDTTVPTQPKWVLTSPSNVAMTTLPKHVGGYKVVIKYTNPTNMKDDGTGNMIPINPGEDGYDKTSGNFISLSYTANLIIKRAATEISITTPELHLPWNGEKQTFDMTKAGISILLPNVMVDNATNTGKVKKTLFGVSNDFAEQPTIDKDTLYGMISVEFKHKNDNGWTKVFGWDTTAQQFVKIGNSGEQEGISNSLVPGIFRVVFRGGNNFEDAYQFVYLKIVNRVFGYDSNHDSIAKSQKVTYDEKAHGITAGIPDGNTDAIIEYIYDGKKQNEPFNFTEAGTYNIEIKISGDKYDVVTIKVSLTIEKTVFGLDDIFVQSVLAQTYDGKNHPPKIAGDGVEEKDGKYYYHGSLISFIPYSPTDATEGIEEKVMQLTTNNHNTKAFNYSVQIDKLGVDIKYTMDAKYKLEFAFDNLQLASYLDASGAEVKCRVKFFNKEDGKEVVIDKTTKQLPKGVYTAQIVMPSPNYIPKQETASFEFTVGNAKSNLGLIIGCSVGGVVVVGGGVALAVVLILKKKKVAKI